MDNSKSTICSNCNSENESENMFCKNCGIRIDGKVACFKCGTFNEKEATNCVKCNSRLDGKKICYKCNSLIDGGAKFCGKCGANVHETTYKKVVAKASYIFKNTNLKQNKIGGITVTEKGKNIIFSSLIVLFCLILFLCTLGTATKVVLDPTKEEEYIHIKTTDFVEALILYSQNYTMQELSIEEDEIEDNLKYAPGSSRYERELINAYEKHNIYLKLQVVSYSQSDNAPLNFIYYLIASSITTLLSILLMFILLLISITDLIKVITNNQSIKFRKCYINVPLFLYSLFLFFVKIHSAYGSKLGGSIVTILVFTIMMIIVYFIIKFKQNTDKKMSLKYLSKFISVMLSIIILFSLCTSMMKVSYRKDVNSNYLPTYVYSSEVLYRDYDYVLEDLGSINNLSKSELEEKISRALTSVSNLDYLAIYVSSKAPYYLAYYTTGSMAGPDILLIAEKFFPIMQIIIMLLFLSFIRKTLSSLGNQKKFRSSKRIIAYILEFVLLFIGGFYLINLNFVVQDLMKITISTVFILPLIITTIDYVQTFIFKSITKHDNREIIV